MRPERGEDGGRARERTGTDTGREDCFDYKWMRAAVRIARLILFGRE